MMQVRCRGEGKRSRHDARPLSIRPARRQEVFGPGQLAEVDARPATIRPRCPAPIIVQVGQEAEV